MNDWKETIREMMNEKILESEKALDLVTSNNLLYMGWAGRIASLRNTLQEFEKMVERHDAMLSFGKLNDPWEGKTPEIKVTEHPLKELKNPKKS